MKINASNHLTPINDVTWIENARQSQSTYPNALSPCMCERPTRSTTLPDAEPHTDQRPAILVVDGEIALCRLLTMSLQRVGYTVECANSGNAALDLLQRKRFHLIILDLMLPDRDGFDVCRAIRRSSSIPIMILSALTGTHQIVRALDMGADGYVQKPFHFSELEAKIQALIRRVYAFNPKQNYTPRQNQHVQDKIIHCGDLTLDSAFRRITIAGQRISLTAIECRLLQNLLQRPNRPVSKRKLLAAVWGYDDKNAVNLVELAITRLRKKIESNPSEPARLITLRGIGYLLHTQLSPGATTSETASSPDQAWLTIGHRPQLRPAAV